MSSQQATFVCKECKEIVHYDFNQKINEDEWKNFQDLGLSSNVVTDPEKILEQSFVFINENWDKLQNHQLNHNIDHKRRLNHVKKSNNQSQQPPLQDDESKTNTTNNANDFSQSLNVLEQILQICAGHAKVEHPLCSDCTDKISKNLDSQMEELNLEKKTLTNYINQWQQEQKEQKEQKQQKEGDNNQLTTQNGSNNYEMDEESRFKQYQEEASSLENKLSCLNVEKK
eukprot:148293_1